MHHQVQDRRVLRLQQPTLAFLTSSVVPNHTSPFARAARYHFHHDEVARNCLTCKGMTALPVARLLWTTTAHVEDDLHADSSPSTGSYGFTFFLALFLPDHLSSGSSLPTSKSATLSSSQERRLSPWQPAEEPKTQNIPPVNKYGNTQLRTTY